MLPTEYFLLDQALWFRAPLSALLMASARFSTLFNRQRPLWSQAELVQILRWMLDDGEIEIIRPEGGEAFFLSTNQITKALHARTDKADLFYGLTTRGGATWENASKPNWAAFCSWQETARLQPPRSLAWGEGTAIAIDRRLAELQIVMAGVEGLHLDLQSVQWDIVTPWSPTYWKQLPRAHRVRFRCRSVERDLQRRLDESDFSTLQTWHKTKDAWYSNPFE